MLSLHWARFKHEREPADGLWPTMYNSYILDWVDHKTRLTIKEHQLCLMHLKLLPCSQHGRATDGSPYPKIAAIKDVRQRTRLGLRDAKEIIDTWIAYLRWHYGIRDGESEPVTIQDVRKRFHLPINA